MPANDLRLMAHIFSLTVILAGIVGIAFAGTRGLSMRWRWWLIAALSCYAVWFFLLAISLKDAELVRRGDVTYLFGGIELAGALLGWTWVILTMRSSFRVVTSAKPPRNIGQPTHGDKDTKGDAWLQAQAQS